MTGHSVKIGCMNCRGLAESVKRSDVFDWIRNKKCDISVLVDIHCKADQQHKWKIEWGNEAFFAPVLSTKIAVVHFAISSITMQIAILYSCKTFKESIVTG